MLEADRGVEFIATLEATDGGILKASCKVQSNRLYEVLVELIDQGEFAHELEARKWAHEHAAARGFDHLRIIRKNYPRP